VAQWENGYILPVLQALNPPIIWTMLVRNQIVHVPVIPLVRVLCISKLICVNTLHFSKRMLERLRRRKQSMKKSNKRLLITVFAVFVWLIFGSW
jgi:hypothetical protein